MDIYEVVWVEKLCLMYPFGVCTIGGVSVAMEGVCVCVLTPHMSFLSEVLKA